MKSSDEVRSALEKGLKGFFRNLVFIEGNQFQRAVADVVKLYLDLNPRAEAAYYFHPWAPGSKGRLRNLTSVMNSVIDIDYSSSERFLGQSFDLVLIDALDDFRPSYIMRAAETARGGGVVIIFTDNLQTMKLYKSTLVREGRVGDLFERRFIEKLKVHRGIIIVKDDQVTVRSYSPSETSRPRRTRMGKHPKVSEKCLTDDQVKVVDEADLVLEEGRKLLAVTASRGRGKSASVGLALSALIGETKYPISVVVTSPSYWSGREVMRFSEVGLRALGRRYKKVESKEGKLMALEVGESRIRWLPPDLSRDADGDFIVVDEAAALGIETLDYLLRKWKKGILVTTVHGYEGSSKAFLKYLSSLEERFDVQRIRLDQPVRYSKGDPLESFLYDVMLLDAEPDINEPPRSYGEVTPNELFEDEKRLRRIYGILVSAHYRNTPDDLMMLGDASFQRIFIGQPETAVAQVVEEGGLDETRLEGISEGGENLGHLIPHRVVKFWRLKDFGKLKGWRVMRIAVAPELQGKGVGTKLISYVARRAVEEGMDWVGSSFLSDIRVLRFWLKNGFIPIHLATKKNESLGGYSLIVLRPITPEASKYSFLLSSYLKDKILRTAHQVYFNVNPELLAEILYNTPSTPTDEIPQVYLDKVRAYLSGNIPYNSAAEAVHALAERHFREAKFRLEGPEAGAIIARTFQGKSWYHAGLSLGKTSKGVEEALREGMKKILSGYIG
jgi:Predicted P-loop ATPase fused to an acetyltransferase